MGLLSLKTCERDHSKLLLGRQVWCKENGLLPKQCRCKCITEIHQPKRLTRLADVAVCITDTGYSSRH